MHLHFFWMHLGYFLQVLGFCAQNITSQISKNTLAYVLDPILDPTLDPTLDRRAPPEPPRAGPDLHSLPGPPELSLDVFCYFSMDLSAKTPTFESISGRQSSQKAIKTRCFRWEGYEKVKKNIAPEWGPSNFCCKNTYNLHDLEFIRGSSGSAGSGGSKRAPNPTFHTRRGPGWRELTQTPSK